MGANAYVSPGSSGPSQLDHAQNLVSMRPPPVPVISQKKGFSQVKTPHPDVTVGIKVSSLLSALSNDYDSSIENITAFFDQLQNESIQHEPNGPLEPLLIPVPALSALDLAFPFAVVEGKAYSTGKQIFEAENQAAVAAACALKILIDLDDLVGRVKGARADSSAATVQLISEPKHDSDSLPPLFFSITTQGPIHELWVHWTVPKDEVRTFESKLLDSCNVLLQKQAQDFMVKVNNVCAWGTGMFKDSVMKRLELVARMADDRVQH